MLSDIYCQVALLHHQEQLATGQRQQLVWSFYPAPATVLTLLASIRRRLGGRPAHGETSPQIQAIPPLVSHAFSSPSLIS